VLASACGDPHFKGFDGTTFEFLGSRGSCYNLLSEQDHQINARFITAGSDKSASSQQQQRQQPTWMGEVAMKYKDDTLRVRVVPSSGGMAGECAWCVLAGYSVCQPLTMQLQYVSAASMPLVLAQPCVVGCLWLLASWALTGTAPPSSYIPHSTPAVLINGAPLSAAAGSVTRQQLGSGARFAYRTQPLAGNTGEPRLLVVTPSMSVAIRALSHPMHHLDVMVLAISPYLCGVHGILGQTYKRMYTEGDASGQAPFSLEGAEWDYELADILSDTFIFNRFRVPEEGCSSNASEEEASNAAAGGVDGTPPLSMGTVREQKQQQRQQQQQGSQGLVQQVQALAAAYDASSVSLAEA
jgi:hypothetical protein